MGDGETKDTETAKVLLTIFESSRPIAREIG